MDVKDALLAIILLLSVTYIAFADKGNDHDDDDDHKDDDDDDDGMPNYCPKDDGMFPNPTDCATYYNCVDGTAIAMSCAPGLLFDAEKKMCNFADRVKCKNQCRGPNGMFPSQHRCDEFVLCTNNKPKVKRCKKGLYFDPNLQVCNYKDQVLCSLQYVPTAECPKPSGIFPNRSNCSSFFLCTDGVHHLQECPGGLHYDRKRVRCNFPDLAKCKDGKAKVKHKPKPSESPKPKRKQSRHCPKMDGIFSNPANCSTFFFCVDGTAYLQECPWGLAFDETNVKCDRPKVVGCTPPSGTLSILQCPDEDGIFRHPVNCHTFYLCKKGRIYEYECPIGLVFNYGEKRCDYKSNVQCPEHHLERRKHQRQYMKVQQINLSEYLT
ncbi:unnamed protein product [Larinioides sclopetarius]|uniref:Chitin-binding type-2 domain-containing protein n=1 Tax=Larinioides sclopetarius TaxID=280406 RepID=A0AAV2AW32_9ARAC